MSIDMLSLKQNLKQLLPTMVSYTDQEWREIHTYNVTNEVCDQERA